MSSTTINKHYLVFSDLDGTLLDERSYSFAAAHSGLDYLSQNQIPLILCTSKTAPEVRSIQQKMQLTQPFIVENGSAVFIPEVYFKHMPDDLVRENSYRVKILGKSYSNILSCFENLKKMFKLRARGFHEMTLEEISERTGLRSQDTHFAKNRQFSEPFVLAEGSIISSEILDYIKKEGYRILSGNRFFHLLGDTDKGQAVRYLTAMFAGNNQTVKTIGIGDSANDFDMLAAVDRPVLVKKRNGSYAPIGTSDHILFTEGIGPQGWQEAIVKLFKIPAGQY